MDPSTDDQTTNQTNDPAALPADQPTTTPDPVADPTTDPSQPIVPPAPATTDEAPADVLPGVENAEVVEAPSEQPGPEVATDMNTPVQPATDSPGDSAAPDQNQQFGSF